MPKIKIKSQEITHELTGSVPNFPKYTSQLMNLANQNSQGTRPKVVGQMTDLFRAFGGKDFEEWVIWYKGQKPEALEAATERVYQMIQQLRPAIELIDRAMVQRWVEDLVLAKTFGGLCFQEVILAKIAALKGVSYRVSTPAEESRGIDGFIGEQPVSVKPSTYSTKDMLSEELEGEIVFYEKKKDGLSVTFDF